MDNQRRFQSADFDLVSTYFGIDVGHTYDGINVTAEMSDTLSLNWSGKRHRLVHLDDDITDDSTQS